FECPRRCISFLVLSTLSDSLILFFFYCSPDHPDLHSFPTRRSSDLKDLGIRVLAGSEVDILKDGSLDYSDEILAQLDVVVCSIRSEEHTSELQSPCNLVCRLLLEKKKKKKKCNETRYR